MQVDGEPGARAADTVEASTDQSQAHADSASDGYPTPPAVRLQRSLNEDIPPVVASYRCSNRSATHPRKKARVEFDETQPASSCANDFWRRALWSPDGSTLLAQSESHKLSHFRLEHTELILEPARRESQPAFKPRLSLQNSFRSPSAVLDVRWYSLPAYRQSKAAKDDADELAGYEASWCYAHSCRDLPTKLVDSTDGSTRASYGIMDHTERFVGPQSLVFSPDNSRLYGGGWSQLSVLSLASPGLNTHSSLPLIQSRSASSVTGEGQRGYVSSLAVVPLPSAHDQAYHEHSSEGGASGMDLIACGTVAGTIGLYAIDPNRLAPPQQHNAPPQRGSRYLKADTACLAGWREAEGDGIHQLAFHPLSPHILFVSSRKSAAIYVYDTRYLIGDPNRFSFQPLQTTAAPSGKRKRRGADPLMAEDNPALLATLPRNAIDSHQRLWFDIDWAGRMLATGDAEGYISIWKIDVGRFIDEEEASENVGDAANRRATRREPDLKWQAHHDAIGSVSFHPHLPLLLSVSGSRHWPPADSSPESSPGSTPAPSSSGEASDESFTSSASAEVKRAWHATDSTMKLWDLS